MSGEVTGFLAGFCVAVLPLLAAGFWLGRRTAHPRNSLGRLCTPVEHAIFQTLHTATLAAPPLRAGLTEETARRSAKRLRTLLGTDALCLTDHESVSRRHHLRRHPPPRQGADRLLGAGGRALGERLAPDDAADRELLQQVDQPVVVVEVGVREDHVIDPAHPPRPQKGRDHRARHVRAAHGAGVVDHHPPVGHLQHRATAMPDW